MWLRRAQTSHLQDLGFGDIVTAWDPSFATSTKDLIANGVPLEWEIQR